LSDPDSSDAAALPASPPFYAIWDERLKPFELKLLPAVTAFCDQIIAPFAEQAAHAKQPMQKSIVREWAKLGMTGLQTPVELGGLGGSYFAKIRVAQELARRSFACAFSLNNIQSLVWMIATRASQQVRSSYLAGMLSGDLVAAIALTEPGGGSDLAAVTTTAHKVVGGWRLTGQKAWVTNATICDLMVIAAQTATGTSGIGRFVVDMKAEGIAVEPAYDVTTGHPIGLGGVRLDHVFVSDACLLDTPGQGFKATMANINGARVHVAAMCVATLEASLAIAIRFCSRRQAFGKTLLEHQGLRWKLADVASQLEAANLLVYRASELIERDEDATLAASHAKKFAASIAVSGVASCMQAMGAQAVLAPSPLARHLAELKLAGYADGTSEMQEERIGSYLLKHYGA
jgi:alkylation response protein AidB-like acyl-CoA dehydrogenase